MLYLPISRVSHDRLLSVWLKKGTPAAPWGRWGAVLGSYTGHVRALSSILFCLSIITSVVHRRSAPPLHLSYHRDRALTRMILPAVTGWREPHVLQVYRSWHAHKINLRTLPGIAAFLLSKTGTAIEGL